MTVTSHVPQEASTLRNVNTHCLNGGSGEGLCLCLCGVMDGGSLVKRLEKAALRYESESD